jgi:taurine transport system permease protein
VAVPPGGPRGPGGKTPDRFQGPDGPEGKDREPVTPEPRPEGTSRLASSAKELTPEEKAKLAKDQADALAAFEAEERGEKPAPPVARSGSAGPRSTAEGGAEVVEHAAPAAAPVADAPAPTRAADAPVAATKATEAKPAAAAKPGAAAPAAKAAAPAAKPSPAQANKPGAQPEADEDPDKIPSAPPWWQTLRADPPTVIATVLGITFIALLFALWWVVTHGPPVERIISPSKLPSPAEVFGSFPLLMKRDIGDSIADTLQRVAIGVSLAAIVGVSAGVFAGAHRGVGAAVAPLVIFLRSVPMGAMIPITLLLFGDEEKQKTMFIFLAIVPFVFSDTVKAISIVPERYVETAQTLGASRFQIIRKVLVPLALPDIITSLRFQFGLALGYIMLVEEINAEHGLGKLIMVSQKQGPYEHVYLLLFVIALIAFTIDLVLRTVQRGVFPWRKDL